MHILYFSHILCLLMPKYPRKILFLRFQTKKMATDIQIIRPGQISETHNNDNYRPAFWLLSTLNFIWGLISCINVNRTVYTSNQLHHIFPGNSRKEPGMAYLAFIIPIMDYILFCT